MAHTDIDIEQISHTLMLRCKQILQFLKRLDCETQELDTDSAQDSADQSVLSISK